MNINANFYDIESLDNVFTLCNYKNKENEIDVYLLSDDPLGNPDNNGEFDWEFTKMLAEVIYRENKNFTGSFTLWDLKHPNSCERLARTFGLSDAKLVNDKTNENTYRICGPDLITRDMRPVCDTDPDYDEDIHPYFMGYNSQNFDTTVLSLFLYDSFQNINNIVSWNPHVTANQMRQYVDELFLPLFKDQMPTRLIHQFNNRTKKFEKTNYDDTRWKIRKNMLMSGRHIDVARLNEKQSKVGLKRILGLLGFQILESDKLSGANTRIYTPEELCELIAYNVSDVVNLEPLLDHKLYRGQFTLKKGLLKTYPELIYDRIDDKTYAPDKRPEKVRRDRLLIDSSSAQFAAKSLCPYDDLPDIPAVSFMYPSEVKAKELGITRVNVLDECQKFFYGLFPQPEIRAQFDRVYDYYKSIEGKDFNQSTRNNNDMAMSLAHHTKANTCLTYFNKDGSPSSGFVTFSTGGIHGAEYNKRLYDAHMEAYNKEMELFNEVQNLFPDPVELKKIETQSKKIMKATPECADRITQIGAIASKFLKSGATRTRAEYKIPIKPELFPVNKKGQAELNKKYVYASSAACSHEDFTSYYPNLLRMMSAFWNPGLGYDRYAESLENKDKYGKKMKDKSLPQSERDFYDILRDGTKLILNAASGAADANFENSIRMNNSIISMRIIGQLFSWRIGQAQTYEGATIISTNTDGLYSVLDYALNNQILEREAKAINVNIEPEPCYLISKDTNNRMDLDATLEEVLDAKGGTLSCRRGPDPSKSLAHPALIDWALAEYLIICAKGTNPNVALDKPFDEKTGMEIILRAHDEFDDITFLNMFQNVTASSLGTMTYIFGTRTDETREAIPLQHYNRVFIMKDGTPDTLFLKTAVGRKITPATFAKRERDGDKLQQHDPVALSILATYGIFPEDIPAENEASIKKINGIDETWYMRIENRALNQLSNTDIIRFKYQLDYEKYNSLLQNCFEASWRNAIPEVEGTPDDTWSELDKAVYHINYSKKEFC